MAQIKEKIQHFLHPDKANKETTPGASPGYADLQTAPTNATTNVPEAFYPGSRPVIPQETHPTAPYTGALGESEPTMKFETGDESTTVTIALETYMPGAPTDGAAPRQAPAVPQDSAAMLGVPPSGGHMTSTQPEEATPTPFPSRADRGTDDDSEQTPETGEDLDEDLPMVPVSDVKTIDSPVTKSNLQAKNYPEEGPQDDVQEQDYEFTHKTPEETNLEDNSSYSPMEEHTEAEPPATDQASDMMSEGGAPHDGYQT